MKYKEREESRKMQSVSPFRNELIGFEYTFDPNCTRNIEESIDLRNVNNNS